MSPYSSSSSGRCLFLVEKCRNMEHLKQAHSLVLTVGLGSNTFALSRLLAFCSDPRKGSHYSYAWKLFQHIQRPTICIWNTMFKAFLLSHQLLRTLTLYRDLLRDGPPVVADNYTLPYVFKACARLRSPFHGGLVHGHSLKSGLVLDIFVGNSLIAMYGEFRDMVAARKVFDEMPELSAVSWTVMISGYGRVCEVEKARLFFDLAPARDRAVWGAMVSGYVHNGFFKESLGLFRSMQSTDIEPDEAMFVTALSACAHLGALDVGIWIHRCLDRLGLSLNIRPGTALIDMYAKCGNLDSAKRVFDEMPWRDTVCWNAMISAMAMHGHGDSALELFRAMDVPPDDVTFIAIFTACSHTGMTYEGMRMFERMREEYKIEPKIEHYVCIIDLLSRAGLFEEAREVIRRATSVSSDPSKEEHSWRAFLSACCKHGEARLTGFDSEKLLRSDRETGFYVLLSNLYAAAGKGGDAGRVRSVMKERGLEKVPGCSSIEIDGTVHEFIAGEKIHRHMSEIHDVLEKINKHL